MAVVAAADAESGFGEGSPRPRVMVIEDEPLIAMGLRMVLEAMGCDVRAVVDNSTDAVSAAETENLDLVLADVRLKGGDDGITAVERILAHHPIAVLFVTGNAGELERRGLGHMDVLSKPFMPAALERKVKKILARV